MKKHLHYLLLFALLFTGCSKDEESGTPTLSEHDRNVISYFKEIALGFEFGNASEVTRKWNKNMKVYVGGQPTQEMLTELERVKNEINGLATDGFMIEVVQDSSQSNFYIFLGTGQQYAAIYPSAAGHISSNWGLFSIFYTQANHLVRGHMYVDIVRANPTEQKHLLREELTQALGLAKDSPRYPDSIFQMRWTTTTSFAPIDKDLIRLLYHPSMQVGLAEQEVENVLTNILLSEK